jgi:hypothetical protein
MCRTEFQFQCTEKEIDWLALVIDTQVEVVEGNGAQTWPLG